jgi:hypothetical protein
MIQGHGQYDVWLGLFSYFHVGTGLGLFMPLLPPTTVVTAFHHVISGLKLSLDFNVRGELVFSVMAANWFCENPVELGKWRM